MCWIIYLISQDFKINYASHIMFNDGLFKSLLLSENEASLVPADVMYSERCSETSLNT